MDNLGSVNYIILIPNNHNIIYLIVIYTDQMKVKFNFTEDSHLDVKTILPPSIYLLLCLSLCRWYEPDGCY